MNQIAAVNVLTVVALFWGVAGADVITAGDASAWQDDFMDVRGWQARGDWLSNPAAAAAVSSDGRVAFFRVPAAGRGMKWSRSIRRVRLDEAPYLFLRYRAANLRTDGEDIATTTHEKVRVWLTGQADWGKLNEGLALLAELTNTPDRGKIIEALQTLVPEYDPLNPPEKVDRRNGGIASTGKADAVASPAT